MSESVKQRAHVACKDGVRTTSAAVRAPDGCILCTDSKEGESICKIEVRQYNLTL